MSSHWQLLNCQLPVWFANNKLIELTCAENPELGSGKADILDMRYGYIFPNESLQANEAEILVLR